MKRILFTVSNDILHDRRMIRICTALQEAGYAVTLLGRQYADSPTLPRYPFRTHRLSFWFRTGKLFYLEMQVRYLVYLMRTPADIQCAVDLDTILPHVLTGWFKGRKLVFDAHEFFTEVPELAGRPVSRSIWSMIERCCVPRMDLIYTVGPALAAELSRRYHRHVHVIRNIPGQHVSSTIWPDLQKRVIWYQGAMNRGRGLEVAIRAMVHLPDFQLFIAGEGDLSEQLRLLAQICKVEKRVTFLGWVAPSDLPGHALQASIAINLLSRDSQSYYYSLANKWFDYVYARLPAIHMAYPEYQRLNDIHPVGILVDQLDEEALIKAIHALSDPHFYTDCQRGCQQHAEELSWDREAGELLRLYQTLD